MPRSVVGAFGLEAPDRAGVAGTEPLVERLWAWCDDERMAGLKAEFRARGLPWLAVANAFAPERGAELRGRLRQPAWARFPTFTIA